MLQKRCENPRVSDERAYVNTFKGQVEEKTENEKWQAES